MGSIIQVGRNLDDSGSGYKPNPTWELSVTFVVKEQTIFEV